MDQMLQSKDTEWHNGFKKKKTTISCLLETQLRAKTHKGKVREWKMVFHVKRQGSRSLKHPLQTKYTLKQRP